MQISQTAILPRRAAPRGDPAEQLLDDYLQRTQRYEPSEMIVAASEELFLEALDRRSGRAAAYVILCDSRGHQLTSEEFAGRLGQLRDRGTQRVVLAIGPADGWSQEARARANLLLSFGKITLPHQLARVVLAEQVYRALTILAGHPYHCGH